MPPKESSAGSDTDREEMIRNREAAMDRAEQYDTAPPVAQAGTGDDDDNEGEPPGVVASNQDDGSGVDEGDVKKGDNPRERLRKSMANLIETDEVEPDPDEPAPAPQIDDEEEEQAPEPDPEPVGDQEPEEDEPPAEEIDGTKLEGKVPQAEWDKYSPDAQQRVNHLRKQLKQSRHAETAAQERQPFADYGEGILQFTKDTGMSDNDMSAWLDVGATVQASIQGKQPPEAAVQVLLTLAKNMGYQEPVPTPEKPDTSFLDELRDNYSLPTEVMATLREKYQPAAPEPQAPVPPAPAPTQPPAPLTTAPRFGKRYAPQAAEGEQAQIDAGMEAINDEMAAASTKYGSQWSTLWPIARREMLSSMDDGIVEPAQWAPLFRKSVKIAVLSKKGPRRTADTNSLAPATGVGEQQDTKDLSAREKLHRRNQKGKLGR